MSCQRTTQYAPTKTYRRDHISSSLPSGGAPAPAVRPTVRNMRRRKTAPVQGRSNIARINRATVRVIEPPLGQPFTLRYKVRSSLSIVANSRSGEGGREIEG